jgi:hypothetical protein
VEYIFKVGLFLPQSQDGANCFVGRAMNVANHVGVNPPTGYTKLEDAIVMEEAINRRKKEQ